MTTTLRLLALTVLLLAAPTAGHAQPAATCQAVCRRLTDCKLGSYAQTCLDTCKRSGYEASEAGRAQLLTFTRYTCQQIQSSVAAAQRPPASPRTTAPRAGSPPATGNPDLDELNRLQKELDDLDRQLDRDSAELDRRSRAVQGPARGAPPRAAAPAPARGATPARGARWTCNAEGSSVYGFDVAGGRGDVRGRSTVAIPGNGGSKDEAAYAAMSSCNSLITANLSTDRSMHLGSSSEGQWGVRVEVACHVTRCAPM